MRSWIAVSSADGEFLVLAFLRIARRGMGEHGIPVGRIHAELRRP